MSELSKFIASRVERGCAPKTVAWYQERLTDWSAIQRPDSKKLGRYLANIANPETRRATWAAIRAFERWRGCTWINDYRPKFPSKSDPETVSTEVFSAILEVMPRASFADRRDRAYLIVLWQTGARAGSIATLRWRDVDRAGIIDIRLKGGHRRRIVAPQEALIAIFSLPVLSDYVFPAESDLARPIAIQTVRRKVKLAANRAGIKTRVWLHGLRHGAAMRWVGEDVPLDVIQRQLCHENISTTQIYARTDLERVRRAIG